MSERVKKWVKFWLGGGASWRTGRAFALCTLTGVAVGLSAVGFNALFELCRHGILGTLGGFAPHEAQGEVPLFFGASAMRPRWWILWALPALGALLASVIGRWFCPEAGGHGTDTAIDAYHRRAGLLGWKVVPIKAITSALTIGSGGSAGCEGPVTLIGAGCGSAIAQALHLSPTERRALLAAGLGAGVGALFRAPLAGALFAAEVLYRDLDLEFEVIIPAMVASVVGYSVFAGFYGWEPLFGMAACAYRTPSHLAVYLLLALVVAAGARLNMLVFRQTELLFRQLDWSWWLKPAMGGLAVGTLGLLAPEVFGTGYGLVQDVLSENLESDRSLFGWGLVGWILILFVLKMVATAATVGSGGSGGVFGPALVEGALLGAATGMGVHLALPGLGVGMGACALVGMAGFLAASIRTPLAAMLMVSEITGNHALLMPSMVVCGVAFASCHGWTLYRSQVQDRFCSPAHPKGMKVGREGGLL